MKLKPITFGQACDLYSHKPELLSTEEQDCIMRKHSRATSGIRNEKHIVIYTRANDYEYDKIGPDCVRLTKEPKMCSMPSNEITYFQIIRD